MTSDSQPRMANNVYLSLGSNIEPERNLRSAISLLAEHGRIAATSTVWETKPIGSLNQPNYLNTVVLLETSLSAQTLRDEAISEIETKLRRVRTEDKNAPRTIDIDVMLFNDEALQLGKRRIPDPEIIERAFVAIPLAEIAPHLIHPETGQTMREIADLFDPDVEGMRPRADVVLFPDSAGR